MRVLSGNVFLKKQTYRPISRFNPAGPRLATGTPEQKAPGSQNGVGHRRRQRTAKMANSINTNAGALIALQNLNATNRDLNVAQNRVNTGLKVSTAKDNGAIFAIATSQRAEMGALDSVKQSIQRGQSIVDVALAAGETITKALEEQKSLAVAIASSTGAAQTAYIADYNALGGEITKALAGASFDGVNLFTNTAQQSVLTSTSGGTQNIGTGAAITVATTATLAAPAN